MASYIRKRGLSTQSKAIADWHYADTRIHEDDYDYLSVAIKKLRGFEVAYRPYSSGIEAPPMQYRPISRQHIADMIHLQGQKRDAPDGSLWLHKGQLWTVDYHLTMHTEQRHDVVILRNIEDGITMMQRVGTMVPRLYYLVEYPSSNIVPRY